MGKKKGSIYERQAGAVIEVPPNKPQGRQDTLYLPEYGEQLVSHMSTGRSFYSFAIVAGVTPRTLMNWTEKYPEFKNARERGESASLYFWEERGLNGMDRGKEFNAQVWIHGMRCRFRDLGWREKYPEDEGQHTTVNNTIQLAPGELAELIKAARSEKEAEPLSIPPVQEPEKVK